MRHDKRTPGRFKVEWEGEGFVGLCSKTYYCFGAKDKYSTKGLNKRNNKIDKQVFFDVLKTGKNGVGTNRGFRTRHGSIFTYIQERSALTYFYAKRRVQPDLPLPYLQLKTTSSHRLYYCGHLVFTYLCTYLYTVCLFVCLRTDH